MKCRSVLEVKSYDELRLGESKLLEHVKEIGMTPEEFLTSVRVYFAKTSGLLNCDIFSIWNIREFKIQKDIPKRNDGLLNDFKKICDKLINLGYLRSDLVAGSLTERVFKILYNDEEAFFDMVATASVYETIEAISLEKYEKVIEVLRNNLSPIQFKMVAFDIENGYSSYFQYSRVERDILEKAWANIIGGYYRFSDDPSQRFISRKISNYIIDIVGEDYAYDIH